MPRDLTSPSALALPRRVKITDETGVWFATASFVPPMLRGKQLGEYLTKLAVKQGVKALYEPATEEEYWNYRDSIAPRKV